KSYRNLFENGCSQDGPCDTDPAVPWEESLVARNGSAVDATKFVRTQGIEHAYRLGDLSSTTDTFLTLLSAPTINATSGAPFCNGNEKQDKDPIRVKCSQNDQVCEADGTLGVVLPIVIPTYTQNPGTLYLDRDPAGGLTSNGVKLAAAPTCTTAPMFVRVVP